MEKLKIHCIESSREDFDEKYAHKGGMEEVAKMVGFVIPTDDGEEWEVTMADGDCFVCQYQVQAQTLASIEEVKALLMRE